MGWFGFSFISNEWNRAKVTQSVFSNVCKTLSFYSNNRLYWNIIIFAIILEALDIYKKKYLSRMKSVSGQPNWPIPKYYPDWPVIHSEPYTKFSKAETNLASLSSPIRLEARPLDPTKGLKKNSISNLWKPNRRVNFTVHELLCQ